MAIRSTNPAVLAAVSHAGFALWQSQILEEAVASHLAMVYRLKPGDAIEKAVAVFESVERQTLGQVLAQLRDILPSGAALIRRLELFKDERNWLVHHSRHDNPSAVHDSVILAALCDRLDHIADEALALSKEVQGATEEHLIKTGQRTRQGIAATAESIRARWHAGGQGTVRYVR